jgi:spore coat assembly protein SafA
VKRTFAKNRSMKEMASPLAQNVRPPAPPVHCCGFVYTVQKGDSLFLIAQRFKIPLQELIAANPQIPNPALIFVGQKICVPTKKPHPPHPPMPPHPPHPPIPPHPPEPVAVEFLGTDGKPLPVVEGGVRLARHTIIKARFPMHVNEGFLFFTPASQPFSQTRLIEAKKVQRTNTVEFQWQVPSNIRGTVFVIGCDGTFCRRSRDYNVISQ